MGGKGRHTSRDGSLLALTAICKGRKLQAAISFSAKQIRWLGNGSGLVLPPSLPTLQYRKNRQVLKCLSSIPVKGSCGRTSVPEGEAAARILSPKQVQKDQHWSSLPEIFRHRPGCQCNSFSPLSQEGICSCHACLPTTQQHSQTSLATSHQKCLELPHALKTANTDQLFTQGPMAKPTPLHAG